MVPVTLVTPEQVKPFDQSQVAVPLNDVAVAVISVPVTWVVPPSEGKLPLQSI